METTLSSDRSEPRLATLEARDGSGVSRARHRRLGTLAWVAGIGLLSAGVIATITLEAPWPAGAWSLWAPQGSVSEARMSEGGVAARAAKGNGLENTLAGADGASASARFGEDEANATAGLGEASRASHLAAARAPVGLPPQTQPAPTALEALWQGEPLISMAGPGARALDWGGWRMSRGALQGEGPEAFMAYSQSLVRLALTPEQAAAGFVLVEFATFGPPTKVTAYLDGKPAAYLQSPGAGTFVVAAVPLRPAPDAGTRPTQETNARPTEFALRAAGKAAALGGKPRTLGLRRLYFTSDAKRATSGAPSETLPPLTAGAEWRVGEGAALRLRFAGLEGPKWLVLRAEAERSLTLTVTWVDPALPQASPPSHGTAPIATLTLPPGRATVSAPLPAEWRSGTLLVTSPGDASAASIKSADVVVPREVPPEAAEAIAKGFNVVLLLIDTLRHDRLHNHRASLATPNVDALAQRSWRFEGLQAADNWTKSSCATVLSGLFPPEHGAIDGEAILPRTVVTLPEGLAGAGYESAAFIANGYVSKRFGFGRGFDAWRNYIREGRLTHAEHVFGDASTWLKGRSDKTKPFFLYIQTIDPHQPYIVPRDILADYADPKYRGPVDFIRDRQLLESFKTGKVRFNDADRQHLEALYDGEVAYHDIHLAHLLETLDTLGVRENTIFIVTSDHGEELFDHESVGHGHSLYQELISVPLLVAIPGVTDGGATFRSVVGHGQIAPSIYRWLGVTPPDDLAGRPTLAEGSGHAATHFLKGGVAVRAEHLKLVQGSLSNTTLYDLSTDPKESAPLKLAAATPSPGAASKAVPELASALPLLWQLAGSYLDEANGHAVSLAREAPSAQAVPQGPKTLPPDRAPSAAAPPKHAAPPRRKHKAQREPLDATTRKQLEALGYIGTSAK